MVSAPLATVNSLFSLFVHQAHGRNFEMNRTINAAFTRWTFILCLLPALTIADEVRVAVASNFRPAMENLVPVFESQSDYNVAVSYSSTGKHYAQLINGAPFDVFLAADTERAWQLESSGVGIAGTRFTYAMGTLVLWAQDAKLGEDGVAALSNKDLRFLAIANPRTAPYGLAAEQFLKNMNLWEDLQTRMVRGENVAQVYAFVSTGNADLGLIALSQARQTHGNRTGWLWLVPETHYEPIEQQAIALNENQAALAFLDFLRGAEAREIIYRHGYSLP